MLKQFIADGLSDDEAHHPPVLPCNNAYQLTSESSLLLTAGNEWWKSGDARRLFMPTHSCSGTLYNANCSAKEVVMKKIKTFESISRSAGNWNFVVDTSAGDQSLK
jgi:hypothetical protein